MNRTPDFINSSNKPNRLVLAATLALSTILSTLGCKRAETHTQVESALIGTENMQNNSERSTSNQNLLQVRAYCEKKDRENSEVAHFVQCKNIDIGSALMPELIPLPCNQLLNDEPAWEKANEETLAKATCIINDGEYDM